MKLGIVRDQCTTIIIHDRSKRQEEISTWLEEERWSDIIGSSCMMTIQMRSTIPEKLVHGTGTQRMFQQGLVVSLLDTWMDGLICTGIEACEVEIIIVPCTNFLGLSRSLLLQEHSVARYGVKILIQRQSKVLWDYIILHILNIGFMRASLRLWTQMLQTILTSHGFRGSTGIQVEHISFPM